MFIVIFVCVLAAMLLVKLLANRLQGLGAWVEKRLPVYAFFVEHLAHYPAPKNLNIWYAFGAMAMFAVALQYITGIWLVMYYVPTAEGAFASVQEIMREVPYGWLIRYLHATGVSAWFLVVYMHIFRALLYGSYLNPRELLWLSGIVLLFLLMAEAYTGYVLPWGQMSLWASKVIISLLSAIPVVGSDLVIWLQGDYEVSGVTLHRFFAFHVVGFSFILLFFVLMHIVLLHSVGSNNPEGIDITKHTDTKGWPLDAVPYYPKFVLKYLPIVMLYFTLICLIVFYAPTFYGLVLEPENFEEANPLVTPLHIKPSWYLSPYYAILRAIPDKGLGALAMLSSIVLWAFLPWLDGSKARSMRYRGPLNRMLLAMVVISFLALGVLGAYPAVGVYVLLSRLFTALYFSYFVLLPIVSRWEECYPVPERIGGAGR